MELTPLATIVLGLMLAAWTFAAAMAILRARAADERASKARGAARRLARMLDHSPALPLLVRGDGALEGPDRLAAWLGFEALPPYLDDLASGGDGRGLPADQVEALRAEIRRTLKTAAPFRLTVTQPGSERGLVLCGLRADRQVAPEGAALVWWLEGGEENPVFDPGGNEAEALQASMAAHLDDHAMSGLEERQPEGIVRRATRSEEQGFTDADRPAPRPAAPAPALLSLLTATLRAREAAVEAKALTVNLSGSRRLVASRAERVALENAFGRLFDEIFAHAPRAGTIDVDLGRDHDRVRVGIVSGTGEGLADSRLEPIRALFEAQGGRLSAHRNADGRGVLVVTLG